LEYRIVIENKAKEKETPVSTDTGAGSNPNEGMPATDDAKQNGGVLATAMVATQSIKPYVQQAVAFSVSQIEMETGSAALQRKANALSGTVGTVAGIVGGGIVGGWAGAAASAATMLVQKMIQTEFNRMAITNQRLLEQENISFQRSRLGLSANRSRGGGVV
jgi:hypothetical protein